METVIAAVGKPSKAGKLQMGTRKLLYADYACRWPCGQPV